jgi:hypothetical protein
MLKFLATCIQIRIEKNNCIWILNSTWSNGLSSVADPDMGSGALLTPHPGSRIGFFGSRIPNLYFLELNDNFSGKKF